MTESGSKLDIGAHPEGVTLRVRAAPGANREGVRGIHAGALKVAVSAPPERGRANDRIRELLAAALGLPARDLILVAGATSRDKKLCVRGVDADELRARVDRAIAE